MKISVVIPTYNAAATIGDALTSCLEQTYLPHEIIVVDDASTDNTAVVVASFEGVTFIQQKENNGPSAARNIGWDAATGDIIAFLDSDDVWHPKKLEKTHEIFSVNSGLEYIGHSYVLDEFSSIKSDVILQQKPFLSILLKNPYQPSCLVLKRNLSERFNESYRYCEDHELSVRIANQHKCFWIDLPLTKLGRPQLTRGGASANKWKMRLGELSIYSTIYKHKILLLPLIPILWLFSLSKMLIRTIRR